MGFKKSSQQVSTPRRRFVQGLIAGGVLAAFPSVLHAASSLVAGTITGTVPELSGKVIDLVIDESKTGDYYRVQFIGMALFYRIKWMAYLVSVLKALCLAKPLFINLNYNKAVHIGITHIVAFKK